MRVGAAQNAGSELSFSRAAHRASLAACLVLTASVGLQRSSAVATDDTRTISLHHVHTNEDLTITYKRNGQYDDEALKKIDWELRDWRKNQSVRMDPNEIDLLWEVYQEVGAKGPIYIVCGYRSPGTNEMLRHRSAHSGVARFSQHTLGKAIDFYIPGVPLEKLRAVAMKLQGGGVGYYPTSGSPFVHLDVGNVRAWPRMTREQLVKLFPDGRTAHIPSDGKPLPGYQLALADLARAHRSAAPEQKRSLLARLFGRHEKDADEADDTAAAREDDATTVAAAQPAPPAAQIAVASNATPATNATPVPLPPRRPIYQIAAMETRPAFDPNRDRPIEPASLSPSDIVNSRGMWDSMKGASAAASDDSAPPDISAARRLLASSMHAAAGHDVTASVGPFAAGSDRVPADVALAYAAPNSALAKLSNRPAATITTTGSGSVVRKPGEPMIATSRFKRPPERLDDPWLRGLVLTDSVQNSLTVTRVGDQDFASFAVFMRKPGSAVVMTFSSDPHLGMTTDRFTGGAVVFPPTITFGPEPQHTAALQ